MGLILPAALLYVLTSMFGDYDDTATRWKAFVIAVAAGVIEYFGVQKVSGLAGALGVLLLSCLAVVALLVVWCRIAAKSAVKIAVIFMAVRIAVGAMIVALTE